MSTESQVDTQVTPEAYQRVISERDEARKERDDLRGQLTASRTINAAESFLRRQKVPEEEISSRVQLLAPHLDGVTPEQISEFLAADQFKPLVTVNAPQTATSGEEDQGEPEDQPPAPGAPPATTPLGFGGPSPASDGKPIERRKFNIRSPEVRDMIARNDPQLESLMKSDQWEPPVRNY